MIMKKILSLLLCFFALTLQAQEQALFRVTYDCTALHRETSKTYRWFLDVGKSQSIFYCPNYRSWSEESAKAKKETDITLALAKIQQVNNTYDVKNSLEVLIGSPSAESYTYVKSIRLNRFLYTEKLPKIEWMVTDSVKQICNYACQKAVAKVYGREWTVWYSSDIPVSAGPYVLKGLPGVILESQDADHLFHFVAVGIEQLKSDTPIQLFNEENTLKCTRTKFLKLRKADENRTYKELGKDLGINIVKIQDTNGNEISNKIQPSLNYLDLE